MVLREIGREGQQKLSQSRVAIIGMGALGTVSANLLARAGVGFLKLIDRDYIEMDNLQRQVLYDEEDIAQNLPKAVAAKRKLQNTNSEIQIEPEVADINPETITELLEDVHLIVDGTDNFETRFLINDFSLKNRIPWIYGGAVRTEGMSYVILPHEGPCLRCLFGESPSPEDAQTCDQVGILAPVAHLIASFQTIEAIKLLAGQKSSVDRDLWKVDLWNRQFKAISLDHLKGSPCSGCRDNDYPYLRRAAGTQAVSLCGRNAVQIIHRVPGKMNFETLSAKLRGQAEVFYNEYLLKLKIPDYEITVFSSGRAIVKGTEDAGQARSLYAKYIGS